MPEFIIPDWPAPARVRSLQTTRLGGISLPPYDSLNLGAHVGDAPEAVAGNRASVAASLPAQPCWLEQVHGTRVLDLDEEGTREWRADAAFSRQPGRVCAVMTADCLPVLFCDREARVVAAAHAGWRGLLEGVLENTVAAMGLPPAVLMAWLGPAIGPGAFEVGEEVRQAFTARDPAAAACFVPGVPGRHLADLYGLARLRLEACGLPAIHGGGYCTHGEAARFFSYRRDGRTGRMVSLIWLEAPPESV
ncbi:peptidoglycan editing factor PgeF [Azovibrio restrictus]|uniref:peptidoglycan editing factor PgeF n=1 Tax=Azovibrio restrictus TaxID=146938 RepID=UPI0026EA1AD3|nr:peptidoglycan editing factor PgeF [Azovibrio restrictus]MDD3484451.1 peptidoglycan editing factor PgeF [Azovibrio restrictus]